MASITFLGNCSNETATLETISFVLKNNKTLLFETGPGITRQLYRAGLRATDIDLVTVSQSHADHSLGYPYFMFTNFGERLLGQKGPPKIQVLASAEVLKGLHSMFAFCYPPGKYSSFEIEEIEASTTELSSFQIDGIRITTTPVTHAVPTIGYRVELGNLSIGYSADTIYDPRFVNLSKNVDLMIHDAFCTSEMKDLARFAKHTTAEEAGKVATEAGAGALALVHFLPAYENRGNELIAEARKAYSGKIFVPREFERVDLAQLPRT